MKERQGILKLERGEVGEETGRSCQHDGRDGGGPPGAR